MRAVVQRVSRARVSVGDEQACAMGAGLLALVGVGCDDTADAARQLAQRIAHLRVFADESGRMNRSLLDARGTLGVVSQFTLYGDARHGRRPSFTAAAPADTAEPLLDVMIEQARAMGVTVVAGRFRAMMDVELVNAGPVTILLDTDKQF